MGVRSVLGLDPIDVARDAVNARAEQDRRQSMARRLELLNDNCERTLREEASRLFSRERRARLDKLLRLGGAFNLFRRIVDEVSRPVYSPPPLRTIYRAGGDAGLRGDRRPGPDQEAFLALARECRLDARMALACRLAYACNASALHVRYNARLGLILDVMAPSQFSVVPDPDDPTRELAIVYDLPSSGRRDEQRYCYWDADEAFVFRADGQREAIRDAQGREVEFLAAANGHPGILPFVVVHRSERHGTYWDASGGSDLEQGQRAIGIVLAMWINLLKTQGHQQLGLTTAGGVVPAADGVAPDQLIDPESAIIAADGALNVLYNPTPVDHFARTVDVIASMVGANHGLNRDRLNQSGGAAGDMAGLLERRAQAIVTFADAEQRLFDVVKVVSRAHPLYGINEDARLLVDYAEISAKAERSKVLDIWQREMEMGLRNPYDCVREDQPEIRDDEEAFAEIERNAEARGRVINLLRTLNARTDGATGGPIGQTPEQNGAMGSAVRDGEMTRDEAHEQAQGEDEGE